MWLSNEKIKTLAKKIKNGYKELRLPDNDLYKFLIIDWDDNDNSICEVVNDGGFRAIYLGVSKPGSIGYMSLWHTNEEKDKFPTMTEITKMLKAILKKEEYPTFSYYEGDPKYNLGAQKQYYQYLVETMLKGIAEGGNE